LTGIPTRFYAGVMRPVLWLFICTVVVLVALPQDSDLGAQRPARTTFKVAYYNIQSGMGTAALNGTCAFERNPNCTDRSKPLNAWGLGVVQKEIERAVKDDPSIIALGLAEAWNCAKPDAVLKVLGWAAHAGERNGISLLARYGFAGPAEWLQLDTTRNPNPADTMWVVRAPVCADASCSRSIQVLTSHWYASGKTRAESFERQARQTIDFMNRLDDKEARVLIGDLNVWAEGETVCNQAPVPGAVKVLRDAGFTDAWPSVHGTDEGYTGMWNRNGCGEPNGYLWKRIDHAWSKGLPRPVSMTRFGMVTPGTCAPSDHAGIIVEYPWPRRDAK
jgi:exonuclease III